jgi:hypothetical protein
MSNNQMEKISDAYNIASGRIGSRKRLFFKIVFDFLKIIFFVAITIYLLNLI